MNEVDKLKDLNKMLDSRRTELKKWKEQSFCTSDAEGGMGGWVAAQPQVLERFTHCEVELKKREAELDEIIKKTRAAAINEIMQPEMIADIGTTHKDHHC